MSSAATFAYRIAPVVARSGKQIFLAIADDVPINGICSPGAITAVNGEPTFYVGGSPVQVGEECWRSDSRDGPFVAYRLRCGGVESIDILDGGEGYDPSTAGAMLDASATGGTGTVLGKPLIETGVTGYKLTDHGSGFPLPPTATIVDLAGGGTGALGYAVIWKNGITAVVITEGGVGYVQPAIRFSSGTAAGVVIAVNGVVTEVVMTDYGDGYPNPPTVSVGHPPGFVGPAGNCGAQAWAVVFGSDAASWGGQPGGLRMIRPLVGGRLGCGRGYLGGSPPAVTVAAPPPGGTPARAVAVVSGYVAELPIAKAGSGHRDGPSVSVSGGVKPAILRPAMTGVAEGDVVTCDLPDSWLTATFRNATVKTSPVSGLPVVNSVGRPESPGDGFPSFAVTPTMRVGGNQGPQPETRYYNYATHKNKLRLGSHFGVRSGTGKLTLDDQGFPATWTLPSATVLSSSLFYGPGQGNSIDQMTLAANDGQYAIVYDDPDVGTANARCVGLISAMNPDSTVFTPVSLSGPLSPIHVPPANVVMSNGGIKSVSLDNVALGAGWEGANVLILGKGVNGQSGNGMANVTVVGGVPTAINVIVPGNYSGVPDLYLYGTRVSGTEVTFVNTVGYVPTTTPGTGPPTWQLTLMLLVAQPQGVWGISDPWVVAPDPRTKRVTLPIDRSDPYAVDDWVLEAMSSDGGGPIASLRFMQATGGWTGWNNYVFASDLMDGDRFFWPGVRETVVSFDFIRPLNTDPASTVYPWSATKVYGPQALYLMGPDDFGRYLALHPDDGGQFLSSNTGMVSFELRKTTPHGLCGGRSVILRGNTQIAAVDAPPYRPGLGLGLECNLFVTGPYTVAMTIYCGGGENSSSIQMLAGTAELPCDFTLTSDCPSGGACMPIEYAAASVSQLPGTALWTNVSPSASDECIRAWVDRIAAHIGPDNDVYVENGNENWNFRTGKLYHEMLGHLLGRIPRETPCLGTTIGSLGMNTSPANRCSALNTANIHAVFLDEWTKLGLSPSRLHFVYGGWFTMPSWSLENLDVAQRLGLPADHICVADYENIPSDLSFVRAMSPAGSVIGGSGAAPADVMNELFRWSILYHPALWPEWKSESDLCKNFGQPIRPSGGTFVNAFVTYTSSGGSVSGITVVRKGVGYRRTPQVTLGRPATGGVQATGRVFLVPSSIDEIRVVHPGVQYTNPVVTITGGGGTYTSASAVLDRGGIASIVVEGSRGYSTTDDIMVSIADATGSGATFSVFLAATSVDRIQVTGSGTLYADTNKGAASVWGSGELPTGTYSIHYTFEDKDGLETTVGLSKSTPFGMMAGGVPTAVMPGLPPWADRINWYVSFNYGPPLYYRSYPRSRYESDMPSGTLVPFEIRIPDGASPAPDVNRAAIHSRPVSLVSYEGGLQKRIPDAVPLQNLLIHDVTSHPSASIAMEGYLVAVQTGHPQYPGTGLQLLNYYSIHGLPSYPYSWLILNGTRQMAGDGASNRYATPQGGPGFDGHDHMQVNDSPGWDAFRKWIGKTSPIVTPPQSPQHWSYGMHARSK